MSSIEEGQAVEFVPLLNFEDEYEILNDYPFIIRKKSNKRVLKESLNYYGYLVCALNSKPYLKHRLIALQFLPNPDPINNDVIDHINRNRTDNHLNNLRWTTYSDNSRNKSSNKGVQTVFVDDIPDDAMLVDFYDTKTERRVFDNNKYYYYFDETNNEDVFYTKITDDIYKILHHNLTKGGNEWVAMRDINNRQVCVMINRFKQQHDLL